MKKILTGRSQISISADMVLGIILMFSFLLVCFLIKSYGASYDEALIHEYSNQIVQIYENLVFYKPYQSLIEFYDLRYYGPAYWTIANLASRPLLFIFPTLDSYDVWHIINFACFLSGVWCLYCLLKRCITPQASLLASLIYLTQPLLWGHAVMNPKDVPFATFFIATLLFGIRMVEEQSKSIPPSAKRFDFLKGWRKYWVGTVMIVTILVLADLIFGHFLSLPPTSAFISNAFSSGPDNFMHSLLLRLAANSSTTPQTAYIEKAIQIINIVEFVFLFIGASLGMTLWFAHTSPHKRWIVLAGIIAGLTISIRVLGPAAMGLTGIYALLKLGRKSFLFLPAYLGVALIVLYLTWPYLWNAPISNFFESINVMANFPWQGQVRFEGNDIAATSLPWYYLPKLIAIQLTLPLLGLAAFGLVISFKTIVRMSRDWEYALISILWFVLPIAWVFLAHPSMYDNFRQFLFILPPLFFFAGKALDSVFRKLTIRHLTTAIYAIVLLPGILAGIWLHPYEYVYYNALVGWTGKVERNYEGDYWLTSLCEAARYINTAEPDGARITLTDSLARGQFERCQEKKYDIVIERSENPLTNPKYSVISTRNDDDLDYFRNYLVIHTIGRGNSIFTVIKKAP